MKKSVKIAIGCFVGLMCINGCLSNGNTGTGSNGNTTPKQPTKVVCQYEQNVYSINGSGTGSNPQIQAGSVIKFNTSSMVGYVDADGTYTGIMERGTNKTIYKIDLTTFDKDGWDKVNNKDNYYQIDSVETMRVTGLEALNAGVPNIDDVTKVYTLRTVTAHAVHHHTEGDK